MRHQAMKTSLLSLALLLGGALLGFVGCGDQNAPKGPPPKFMFELEAFATTEGGKPAPGLPVLLDGKIIGYTDRNGEFRGVIHEEYRKEVELRLGEVDEFAYLEDPFTKQELVVKKRKDGKLNAIPVSLIAKVRSRTLDYLVWVKVECEDAKHCEDLPVKAGDEIVATTDAFGRAHFVHEGTPGSVLEVTIENTVEREEGPLQLEPANPVYEIELGEGAEVLSIQESFSPAEVEDEGAGVKKKTRRKKPRKKTRRKKPRKKKTTRKKPKKKKKTTRKKPPKKKEPKKEEPIQLF